jgi:transposase-like protein
VKTPQECPDCAADLSDPTFPVHRPAKERVLFTRALTTADQPDHGVRWHCPDCKHEWVVKNPGTIRLQPRKKRRKR